VASGIAYQLQGKITDDTKTTVNTPITTKKTMTALTQSHGPQLSTFSSLKKNNAAGDGFLTHLPYQF
jgi:hypothetical protein